MSQKIILELNNIDIYGKRFNGYSLQQYLNQSSDYSAKLLVNHKYSKDQNVAELFSSDELTSYDWQIEPIEEKLHLKNQISISEDALISHPLYQEADLLHFHMYHNMHLPIEFLTRIPASKQILIEVHDTFWLTDKNIPMLEVFNYSDLNKTTLDAQRKRVLNSIDATFVVHSPYTLNLFKKSDTTKNLKVHLIPFGIDTNVFKPKTNSNLRQKYNIKDDSFVLMCRSQKEFKGIGYIVKALKLLKTPNPITIITTNTKGLLKEIEDKYQIIDLGMVNSEEEMCDLYNLCDIFLAPSTEESFGFMAVEAMSCEKPVIVFEGTALPDTTHAPSIGIATKKSATALANAIKYLIDHPDERIARGKAGREYVLQNYTEEKYFKNYLDLFNQLLSKGARKTKPYPKSTAPKNLDCLVPLLEGKIPDEKFDYNNLAVQNEIKNYNSLIYSKIVKQDNRKTIKKVLKRIIKKIRK